MTIDALNSAAKAVISLGKVCLRHRSTILVTDCVIDDVPAVPTWFAVSLCGFLAVLVEVYLQNGRI